jgi:hypothetical protein
MRITLRRLEGIWEASIKFDDGKLPMHIFSLTIEGVMVDLLEMFGGEICLKTA